ncbi:IS110 family transposase [Mesorhizobium sp. L-8-10]|uniref:IS110 family transposase n=1 Tax=Mesorhizobium sp. L-8-10 TaxID=2744523 RepID=UPI0019292B81|nr:IS110 family transposase [Mesorhizobium sp. L-8-10]
MNDTSMKCAGVDVSKAKLDVAVFDGQRFVETNDAAGHRRLAARLTAAGVERVGMEASGNYEAAVRAALEVVGFAVKVFDPRQVHGYRIFRGRRAKNDAIDAHLILAATAALGSGGAAADPRLAAFQEHMTLIDALTDDIARHETRRDRFSDPAHRRYLEAEIRRLSKRKSKELAKLIAKVKAHADLAKRFALLLSIPGLGEITALVFVVRMPELGRLSRAEAAALVGVAPFDHDSGTHAGQRRIAGGRRRLRKAVYMAAFSAANHWNPILVAFRKRLVDAGKTYKQAIVACARKLVHMANAVLARGTPWNPQNASA